MLHISVRLNPYAPTSLMDCRLPFKWGGGEKNDTKVRFSRAAEMNVSSLS